MHSSRRSVNGNRPDPGAIESDFGSDTVVSTWDGIHIALQVQAQASAPSLFLAHTRALLNSTLGKASANMMMMTMRASDVLPPPRPSCYPPASCGLSSLVSSGDALPPPLEESSDVDDYPMSDEEYQALMLAEFGPPMPLPPLEESSDVDCPMSIDDDEEYQALMLAEFGPMVPLPLTQDDQVQAMVPPAAADEAPALLPVPEEESWATVADESEMKARLNNKERHRKKRKRKESPPPTEDGKIEDLSTPRARSKMMATRLLEREHGAPEPTEQAGRTVLWCQCKELPLDAPACALHQPARFRSWMLDQDQIPAVGSDDGVVVPKRPADSRKTVLKYIRWRSRVWMPSRFYIEHAQSMEMTL